MPITVLSPYSGKPVKVRDNDAGRAVRDEEGRIFYVLAKSDGTGYYGATTRAGNPKEEARALELESKVATGQGEAKTRVDEMKSLRKPSRGLRGPVLFILIVAALAAAGYLFFYGPLKHLNPLAPGAPATPAQESPAPSASTGVGGPATASASVGPSTASDPSTAKALLSAAAASGTATGLPPVATPDPESPNSFRLPSGLKYTVLKAGEGAEVKPGDRVQVRYTGSLAGGVRFENSSDNEGPFLLTVGAPRNLRFWNEALPGMAVGEKRKLTVPPALAYGNKTNAIVPPNSTLVYEVELLAIIKPER